MTAWPKPYSWPNTQGEFTERSTLIAEKINFLEKIRDGVDRQIQEAKAELLGMGFHYCAECYKAFDDPHLVPPLGFWAYPICPRCWDKKGLKR